MKLPRRRRENIVVLLPSNIGEQCNDDEELVLKLSYILRACSCFRVETIFFYKTRKSDRISENKLLKLAYALLCPAHLRKKLIPYDTIYRSLGTSLPIMCPSHQTLGEIMGRPILSVSEVGGKIYCGNIGLDFIEKGEVIGRACSECKYEWKYFIPYGKKKKKVVGAIVCCPRLLKYYLQPCIFSCSMSEIVRKLKEEGYVIVGTSKFGKSFEECAHLIKTHENIALVFGSPYYGIFELEDENGKKIVEYCDIVLNFAPDQGVRTIRVEEALYIVLSKIDMMLNER